MDAGSGNSPVGIEGKDTSNNWTGLALLTPSLKAPVHFPLFVDTKKLSIRPVEGVMRSSIRCATSAALTPHGFWVSPVPLGLYPWQLQNTCCTVCALLLVDVLANRCHTQLDAEGEAYPSIQ